MLTKLREAKETGGSPIEASSRGSGMSGRVWEELSVSPNEMPTS
mgnify:CR=1 FL=1